MLAADAANWKSACSLAQQQRNALERQIHNNSLTTPLPPLAITAPPLLSPDGLPAPLSPTRDSSPALFGMLIDEPNTGVPLIHITQLEAGANERRKVVVEKMEREVEEKETEILELRRELAEAREIVQQQEEEKDSVRAVAPAELRLTHRSRRTLLSSFMPISRWFVLVKSKSRLEAHKLV